MTPSPDSPETWSTQASSPQGINDWHDATIYSTLPSSTTTNGQHQMIAQQQLINHTLPTLSQQQHHHQLISELNNSQQVITTTTTEPMLTEMITINHREPNVNQTAAVFI